MASYYTANYTKAMTLFRSSFDIRHNELQVTLYSVHLHVLS